MMRHLTLAGLILLFLTGPACGQDSDEAAARQDLATGLGQFMQGRYNVATDYLTQALGHPATRLEAQVALARVNTMRGRYDQALEILTADGDAIDDLAWRLAMAEVLSCQGQYEEALTHAMAAIRLDPRSAQAVLACGELLETLGRNDDARAIYETIEAIVDPGQHIADPVQLVAIGRVLEQLALLTGERASIQTNHILNDYYLAAVRADESYWPAHLAAGQLALAKHRLVMASEEFDAALQLNANLPEAITAQAMIALMGWDFETCLLRVEEALEINPRYVPALNIRAACLMQWRKYTQVTETLEEALAINPNDLETLSLAAALHVRNFEADQAQPFIDRVEAINPNCELLPLYIAEWLSAGRQFELAEQYYLQAARLAPHSAQSQTGLGQLYMQTGEEAQARDAFERAHAIDDFRADVVNYLNLLEEMDDYMVVETEHFIVKVDPEHDAVLAGLVAEEAERIFAEVSADFGHVPQARTIIEVFPTHERFSVRLTGRGWLGTVGACTGRVIVMVAPGSERGPFGEYNWATVLRHEYAHTVTLAVTGNRIPHWFTEACAVWEQPDRRNFEAVGVLVAAYREDRLFPAGEINWGFIRPERGSDRHQAYAQSEWMLEYIIETHGFAAVGEMLEAFRSGLTQPEVFEQVLEMTEAEFDEAFRLWAGEQIEEWGFDTVPMGQLEQLRNAANAAPDDPAPRADFALATLREVGPAPAIAQAQRALELDPAHPRALGVMAAAYLLQEEYEQALEYAGRLELAEESSPVAARVASACFIEAQRWNLAVAMLEQLQQRRPMDPYSYEQLTGIYVQLGQVDKALPNLIEMHRRSMDTQEYARQVADIYRAAGEEAYALHYYQEVLRIDPYEVTAHEAIAAIHRNAGRYQQAVASAARLPMLNPQSPTAWAQLAMVRFVAARAMDDTGPELLAAWQEATRSMELDTEGPGEMVRMRIETLMNERGVEIPAEDETTPDPTEPAESAETPTPQEATTP
jgi:tetratricopeptide (TPR) repeat protein